MENFADVGLDGVNVEKPTLGMDGSVLISYEGILAFTFLLEVRT